MAFRLHGQGGKPGVIPPDALAPLVFRQAQLMFPERSADLLEAAKTKVLDITMDVLSYRTYEWEEKHIQHNLWETLTNMHFSMGPEDTSTGYVRQAIRNVRRKSQAILSFALAAAMVNGRPFHRKLAETLKPPTRRRVREKQSPLSRTDGAGVKELQAKLLSCIDEIPAEGLFTDRFNKRLWRGTAQNKRTLARAKVHKAFRTVRRLRRRKITLRSPKRILQVALASKVGALTTKNCSLYAREAYPKNAPQGLTGAGTVFGPGSESAAAASHGLSSTTSSNGKAGTLTDLFTTGRTECLRLRRAFKEFPVEEYPEQVQGCLREAMGVLGSRGDTLTSHHWCELSKVLQFLRAGRGNGRHFWRRGQVAYRWVPGAVVAAAEAGDLDEPEAQVESDDDLAPRGSDVDRADDSGDDDDDAETDSDEEGL